ncbi:GATA transcription factor [Pseudohyphozyma bogoriensis]|nr:GATA transcription factor [Pseudohyphozyma bogoriensis]
MEMYWRQQSEDDKVGLGSTGARSNSGSSAGGGAGGQQQMDGGGGGAGGGFDPMEYARLSPSALDPSAFSGQFVTPRFAAQGGGGYGPAGGYGSVAVAEPDRAQGYAVSPQGYGSEAYFANMYPPLNVTTNHTSTTHPSPSHQPVPSTSQQQQHYTTLTYTSSGPVYENGYGTSVVSVNTPSSSSSIPYKFAAIPMPPSTAPSEPFSPGALGLPIPPSAGGSTNFAGLYSSSGFDIISVLVKVQSRPNPTINIGPVDTSCSFTVVDARKFDMPIVYASETFSRLTGYSSDEIMGRNCRFLQAPDAQVAQGQPRKYTDSQAAWHMRRHISEGKESQSSLINYSKGGRAFINLVTLIPISWDNSDEIAYYVGFQVDLVDQPNAILSRMRDGSYVVNYSLLNNFPKTVSMISVDKSVEEVEWEGEMMAGIEESVSGLVGAGDDAGGIGGGGAVGGSGSGTGVVGKEVVEKVVSGGVQTLGTDELRKAWNTLLLEESNDFIHVLSLKGSILYASPSAGRVLDELVGKTIQGICHPSDIVPVMRELKDAGSIQHPYVNLLYRVQRKHSGYIWLEAAGKLHVEPGKGRKAVILVGRPRSVYTLSWEELRESGGIGDNEFWTKLSAEGMVLACTPDVGGVLGFKGDDLLGTSMHQLVKPEAVAEILRALDSARSGTSSDVRYSMKGRTGWVEVVTHFYGRKEVPLKNENTVPPGHDGIIAQTNEASSHDRKLRSPFVSQVPELPERQSTPESDSSSTPEGGTPFRSTFKTLSHPSAESDNAFDELDSTRATSWMWEFHQLQILNKKLRDERDYLDGLRPNRGSVYSARSGGRAGSASSRASRASSTSGRTCANCGRPDSPEWRLGPTGPKTLCNACGLRWAKSEKERAAAMASGSTSAASSGSRSDPNSYPSVSLVDGVFPVVDGDGDQTPNADSAARQQPSWS